MSLHYAVTNNGQSVVGMGAWQAPSLTAADIWVPGEWLHAKPPLDIYYGPTLVDEPIPFLEPRCEVYLAEGRGDFITRLGRFAYRSSRLVRPAPEMIPQWWRDTEVFLDSILAIDFLSAKDAGSYTVYDPAVHTGIDAATEREHKAIIHRTFSLEPKGRLKATVMLCIITNVRARLDALGVSSLYTSRITDDAIAYWSLWVAKDIGQVDMDFLANARTRWAAWCSGHAVVGGTEDVVVYEPPFIRAPTVNIPSSQPLLV